MGLFQVEELPSTGFGTVRVRIMGQTLCAGFPSPADDFLEGALELPRWLVPNPPATFLWNISGDSMRGAGIFDRDLACVDRSLSSSPTARETLPCSTLPSTASYAGVISSACA